MDEKWIDKRIKNIFDKIRVEHTDIPVCYQHFNEEISKLLSEIVWEIVPKRRKGTHTNHFEFDSAIDCMEENVRRIGVEVDNENTL